MGVVTGGVVGTAFHGGTITQPLIIDQSASGGGTIPLRIKASYNDQSVDFLDVLNTDNNGVILAFDAGGIVQVGDGVTYQSQVRTRNTSGGVASLDGATLVAGLGVTAPQINATTELDAHAATFLFQRVTSGALPTTTFVSGTGKQIDTTTDRMLVVPCTLNPTAGAAATVAVALSPDDVTYSTVGTLQEPAGTALDNTIQFASLIVPGAWFVKLTATNATIGTGTYY